MFWFVVLSCPLYFHFFSYLFYRRGNLSTERCVISLLVINNYIKLSDHFGHLTWSMLAWNVCSSYRLVFHILCSCVILHVIFRRQSLNQYFFLGEHCGLRSYALLIFLILGLLFGLHVVINKLSQVFSKYQQLFCCINKDFNIWVNAIVK